MNALLLYPEFPKTHWNFKHVLKLISKKATDPALGLLTVSSLLPESWNKKLIDLNISKLKSKDLKWSDLVFVSGTDIQKSSFINIIRRCHNIGVKIAAGGPMVTQNQKEFPEVDFFILGEAENIISVFIEDFANGTAKKIYKDQNFPDIKKSPVPDWNLINMHDYVTMDLQYSRGCPFDCDFCSISTLFGKKLRTKSTSQFINELESLYITGWTGDVFIVDDNFIGNKRILKEELLPEMIKWQKKNRYPFRFNTEVSINLADDEELMDMMIDSGFISCFVGIETPDDDCLSECGKKINMKRDMINSVKTMQKKGFNVSAGFIIGFDSDKENIFERQFDFIQKSGIVNAMVGLLNAPSGTKLYERLKKENRILETSKGNNVDGSLNFITKMDSEKIMQNYKKLVRNIYSPKNYSERIMNFLSEYKIPEHIFISREEIKLITIIKVVLKLGFLQFRGKYIFWKTVFFIAINYPSKIILAVTLFVYGLHFRKIAESL